MTNVYEIPTTNFDDATMNLSQARAMLNVLAVSADDGDGFSSQREAIDIIHAAVQKVDEAVRTLDSSFVVGNEVLAPEALTSGM